MEIVYTLRGCPLDKYNYELMKDFYNNKEKYEPLKGFHVYIRRNLLDGTIKVCKLINEDNELLNNIEYGYGPIYYDSSFVNYDSTIQIEYLGSDIDLGIEPGEKGIIGRNDNGELYLLCKKNINSGRTSDEYNKFNDTIFGAGKINKSIYVHYSPLPHEINSNGSLDKYQKQFTTYNWI